MKISHRYFGAFAALLLILTLALAEGCASIGNPSGGPRDERPPRFMSASPAPGSVDIPVDKERFTLTFDELIEVKDPTTKVIISPPSKNIPRVAAQGHRVTVTFQDSLQPNTTYTVDFADAIQDLNEGNQLKNFSYTFSTGPTLDSLRIAGRVLSALEMEPMQLKLVGLHRLDPEESSLSSQYSLPSQNSQPSQNSHNSPQSANPQNINQSLHKSLFTKPFDHVGRTDDRGQFSIEGLAPGRYRVYALDDTNSDYIFSNSEEEVAFLDVDVSPSFTEATAIDSIFNLKTGLLDTVVERHRTVFLPNDLILRSAKSRRNQQYIEKYERVDSTRINLLFHYPNPTLPSLHLVGMPEGSEPFIIERSATNDTIALWLRSPALVAADTLRLDVGYMRLDSLQQYQLKNDTLRLTTDRTAIKRAQENARRQLEKQAKQLAREAKRKAEKGEESAPIDSVTPPTPLMRIEFKNGSNQEINRPLIFETSVPPLRIDTTAIHLEEKVDTIWRSIPLPPLRADSLNPRRFMIGDSWKGATDYRLTIDSLAITGMYGLNNRKSETSFRTKEDKQYCSLILRLTDWPTGRPAYVELLNQSDSHVALAPVNAGKAEFRYLAPGKYYARIIDDRNADMRWDSGDPLTGLQPEEAYYYPKAINIKQNWNKDESWAVFATPVDKMKPELLLKNKPTLPKGRTNNRNRQQEEEDDDEE